MKISELFYSIQGEGWWSGTPMLFIRLSGCSEGCIFCDTKYALGKEGHIEMEEEDIFKWAQKHQGYCNKVCITGGEPTEQDLSELLDKLSCGGFWIQIETNGKHYQNCLKRADWITVSPKGTIDKEVGLRATEFKYVIGPNLFIPQEAYNLVKSKWKVCLQPLDNDMEIARKLAETCKNYGFRLSIQIHKLLWGGAKGR